MSRRLPLALALVASLTLGACATPTAPVSVTRFHLGQALEKGTIFVEPAPGGDSKSLEFGAYAAAVTAELQRVGYVATDSLGQSLYVAVIDVQRGTRADPVGGRSPVTIGIGGGTGGWGGGVGAGLSFGLGGKRGGKDIESTQLSVVLKRRGDQQVMWEGRARGEARSGAPAAQTDLIAGRLANALFRDFPGESGRTISVP
jgi:hypothetical protein